MSGRRAPEKEHEQKEWDAILCEKTRNSILSGLASTRDKDSRRSAAPGPANGSSAAPQQASARFLTTTNLRWPATWGGDRPASHLPKHVEAASHTAGSAVARAESLKLQKYSDLAAEYFVSPLAYETLGGPGLLRRRLGAGRRENIYFKSVQ